MIASPWASKPPIVYGEPDRFDDHGRSTGEQQKATVELQDLATEGRRSHRFIQKHGTAAACITSAM